MATRARGVVVAGGIDSFETWHAAGSPGALVIVEQSREATGRWWGPVPTRAYCLVGDDMHTWTRAALADAAREVQRGRSVIVSDQHGVIVSTDPHGRVNLAGVAALTIAGAGAAAMERGDFVRAVLWAGGERGAQYKLGGDGRAIVRVILEHGGGLRRGELRAIYRRARERMDDRGARDGLAPWQCWGIDGCALMEAYEDVMNSRN